MHTISEYNISFSTLYPLMATCYLYIYNIIQPQSNRLYGVYTSTRSHRQYNNWVIFLNIYTRMKERNVCIYKILNPMNGRIHNYNVPHHIRKVKNIILFSASTCAPILLNTMGTLLSAATPSSAIFDANDT